VHQRRQALRAFTEVDRLRRHLHAHRAVGPITFDLSSATMIAVTIEISAPGQTQTARPIEIKLNRRARAGGRRQSNAACFGGKLSVSTTPQSPALRHRFDRIKLSRRQVNN
jgi:hypothetical protein